jgi:dienelactone hydrolase
MGRDRDETGKGGSMRNPEEMDATRVEVSVGEVTLEGELAVPDSARGLVIFAHGSGSSRFSPRNQAVAAMLDAGGLATLLFDLLTPEEDRVDRVTRELRFDIPMLGKRVVGAIDWASQHDELRDLDIGCFGASTGAAAALIGAAARPKEVKAVVSRGGRPDLAMEVLGDVRAPTLLIVGGRDKPVIDMNRRAFERLRGEKEMEIVAGATHLFEEPGALEEVSRLARDWFLRAFRSGG